MERTVFFVSDRTGITAETLGHSLLTQFENIGFTQITLPFVDSVQKAISAVEQINRSAREQRARPIVFSTLIDPETRYLLAASNGVFFDFFDVFIGPLEKELQIKSSHTVGRSHGLGNASKYNVRMDAVGFSLGTDDGIGLQHYARADIILAGVSRSGKTPTCLYLALQFGIHAANYPLMEEDLADLRLSASLGPFRAKLFGLSIDPERLHQLRHERRPNSRYASLKQCQYEVNQAEALFRTENIAFVNTTTMSIEEIATTILHQSKLERRLY
ncbi:MAG: kinase/pyrophosphorylase [Gammaproteobacteria bacterium]|nr:kinase/pyrophosphorylase [Gammaproteobacteria bacterium]